MAAGCRCSEAGKRRRSGCFQARNTLTTGFLEVGIMAVMAAPCIGGLRLGVSDIHAQLCTPGRSQQRPVPREPPQVSYPSVFSVPTPMSGLIIDTISGAFGAFGGCLRKVVPLRWRHPGWEEVETAPALAPGAWKTAPAMAPDRLREAPYFFRFATHSTNNLHHNPRVEALKCSNRPHSESICISSPSLALLSSHSS